MNLMKIKFILCTHLFDCTYLTLGLIQENGPFHPLLLVFWHFEVEYLMVEFSPRSQMFIITIIILINPQPEQDWLAENLPSAGLSNLNE